jgi:hypothetical protein
MLDNLQATNTNSTDISLIVQYQNLRHADVRKVNTYLQSSHPYTHIHVLSETYITPQDINHLATTHPFKLYSFKRPVPPSRTPRTHMNDGGITVAISHTIANTVTVTHHNEFELVELSFTTSLTPNKLPLHIYGCYVPLPTTVSLRRAQELFTFLQLEILGKRNTSDIIVLGDMNGRVPNHDREIAQDLLFWDDHIAPTLPPRLAGDTTTTANTFGRIIRDFCKATHLSIANGRESTSMGYTHSSTLSDTVIDYGLYNPGLFEHCSFSVLSHSALDSDHAALRMAVKICHAPPMSKPKPYKSFKTISWTPANKSLLAQTQRDLESTLPSGLTTLDELSLLQKQSKRRMERAHVTYDSRMPLYYSEDTKRLYTEAIQLRNKVKRLARGSASRHSADFLTLSRQRNAAWKAYRVRMKQDRRAFYRDGNKHLEYLVRNDPKALWRKVNPPPENDTSTHLPAETLIPYVQELAKDDQFDFMIGLFHRSRQLRDSESFLCRPVTDEELECVLSDHVANGKAAGIDGLPNEVSRYASEGVRQRIKQAFNQIIREGPYPAEWKTSIIQALYKGAGKDPSDPSSYRTLMIAPSLARIFSALLHRRLLAFCDHLLVDEQYGFRPGRAVEDATYIVHRCIREVNKSRKRKRPLYLIFVDFKKAFDTVLIPSLLLTLQGLGIPESTITLIQEMYTGLKATTREDPTQMADLKRGVKQGDPLSPLLFNIYINSLKSYLLNKGIPGFVLNEEARGQDPIRLLLTLYADDTVLYATSREAAVQALQALYEWCDSMGLTVNADKTKIMAVNPETPTSSHLDLMCQGQPQSFEFVQQFRYLGTILTTDGSFETHTTGRCKNSNFTQARYNAWIKTTRDVHPKLAADIYDAILSTTHMFGCHLQEAGKKDKLFKEVEERRLENMRRLYGVYGGASGYDSAMYADMGKLPFEWHLLKERLRFLYKLQHSDPTSLLHRVYQHDLSLPESISWYRSLHKTMVKWEVPFQNTTLPIDWESYLYRAWWLHWFTKTEGKSTMPIVRWTIAESLLSPYAQQNHRPRAQWFLRSSNIDRQTRKQLVRFRRGELPLHAVMARRLPNGEDKLKARNWCPMCSTWTPDDYSHFLYDCNGSCIDDGPTLSDLRRRLFTSILDIDLRHEVRHGHPTALYTIINRPWEHRAVKALTEMARFRSRHFKEPVIPRGPPDQVLTNEFHAIDASGFKESIDMAIAHLKALQEPPPPPIPVYHYWSSPFSFIPLASRSYPYYSL